MVLLLVCGRPSVQYGNFEIYVRPWLAFAVISALPFCLIACSNVFIVRALVRCVYSASYPQRNEIQTDNEPDVL